MKTKTTVVTESEGTTLHAGTTHTGKTLLAYRLERVTTTTHVTGDDIEESTVRASLQGLAFEEDYLEGFRSAQDIAPPVGIRSYSPYPGHLDPNACYTRYIAVWPGWAEALRLHGGGATGPGTIQHCSLLVEDPWSALQKGRDFSIVELSGGMAYTLEGKALPVRQVYDYIKGYMSDAHYVLHLIVPILLKRKDVEVTLWAGEREPWDASRFGKDSLERYIRPIPTYNADEDRQFQIRFVWHPSAEDFQKCFEHQTVGDSATATMEAALALDIFGIGPPML